MTTSFKELLWEEDDYVEPTTTPDPQMGRPRKYDRDHAEVKVRMNRDVVVRLDAKRPPKTSREDYIRSLIMKDIDESATA